MTSTEPRPCQPLSAERDAVVVFGGYGAVGRAATEALAEVLPGRVIVAGRDAAKARHLATTLPGGVRSAQVDVTRTDQVASVLDGAAVAVMCIEQANAGVARACVEHGVHYLDVSATTATLDAIVELDPLAKATGATAALSVGLAPGITNLLARVCHERLPTAQRIDITLCLGLGGDHGADSRRWVLDALAHPGLGGTGRRVRPMRVRLPGLGIRTAHPFPFSDQDTLTAALGIPVVTRLSFDSRTVTTAAFALRRAHLFALLGRNGVGVRLARLLERLPSGDDRFVVHVTASDAQDARVSATVRGRGECSATGVIAARVASLLAGGSAQPGVRHIGELVDPETFLRELDRDGIVDYPAELVRETR